MALEWSSGGHSQRIAQLDAQIRDWPRHGGNDPYKEGFERLAAVLRPLLPVGLFAVAYNEFCRPSVPEGIEELIRQGAVRVLVVPTMMTPGGVHSEKDIPRAIRQVQEKYPDVSIEYLWPFDLKQVAALLALQVKRTLER